MDRPSGQVDMNVVVLLGSVRPGNYTAKAAAVVIEELEGRGASVDVIDPTGVELYPPGVVADGQAVETLRRTIRGATGVIICTPEYHGSFSAMIKLIIENLGYPSGLHDKPVGLLGVANGAIGAIKSLEHLRSVCSHVGAIVLPGPASVAQVQQVFDADGRCTDLAVEKRLRGLAAGMVNYLGRHVCPAMALEEMVRSG